MRRFYRLGRGLLAAVGLVWLVVTTTPLVSWWANQMAQPWGNGKGDVLIVLGGDSMQEVIGWSSYVRSYYTVRAIRAQPYRRVIISGGGHDPAPAQLMKEFIRSQGIDVSKVELETASRSTEENAVAVARMLQGETGKVVLLTSEYHVWRALRTFAKAGVTVDPLPAPDILKRESGHLLRFGLFLELLQESAKIGWYRWKGWA
jgi:uncharacterized SAM-binding protein YcdF (DUF218 family)